MVSMRAFARTFLDDDDLGWKQRAACRGVSPSLFFSDYGGDSRQAQEICAKCPVRHQCLAYSVAHNEEFGVWGGMGEKARRKLHRNYRADESAAAVAI